ncbi:MAG: UDP-2,4-diacetamido-2,4,6-trideoxy-beta-L-altropyranose hydrolase [Succinatimonas hippei]|nr:UDP-2,4-diacetamido-2,4,6-trideoxy-beta-L-altropyranose hydrolase [Succinatimonas hippei]
MTKKLCVVLKADHVIGTGHLMRVKGLLQPLIGAGFTPYLITDSLEDSLLPLCTEYKEIFYFKSGDPEGFASLVRTLAPDITLFDHYFIGREFESAIENLTKIAVIDDLEREHDCALLTDSGFFKTGDEYKGKVPKSCRLLCGERYSLIRDGFSEIAKKRPYRARLRVLINYGGADPAHACLKALTSVIKGRIYEKYDFIVLSGISNPDHEKLSDLAKEIPQIEVIRNSLKVPEIFTRCDMAMGALGGMFKERMCAGLPALNTVIADNQKGGEALVEKLKCGLSLNLEDLCHPERVAKALSALEGDLAFYRQNGMRFIEGRGIGLVSRAIIELAL